MSVQIIIQPKLKKKAAYNLVLDMLRYNTLANMFPDKSDLAVIEKFNHFSIEWKMKGDFDHFAEICRDYSVSAPFENLADSGLWEAQGGTLGITDNITGETSSGHDVIAISSYQGLFYDSFKLFQDSLKMNTFIFFKSSIVSGISSIESFLRQQANYYNIHNPQDLLIDNKENKVSFYDKFKLWIPKMTGNNFDKSRREWESLKKIVDFRDNETVHLKGAYGYRYDDLELLLNLYKYAIPGILRQLHIDFNLVIPSNIIRASYYPEISIKKVEINDMNL